MNLTTNFRRGLVLVTVVTLAGTASAGSAIAVTQCASDSGRTKVEVLNQDRGQFLSATYDIDSEKKTYTVDSADGAGTVNAQGDNLDKLEEKVYTVSSKSTVQDEHAVFTLWALPDTVRKVTGSTEGRIFRFKAKVIGTDPRAAKDGEFSPEIVVNCVVTYSI